MLAASIDLSPAFDTIDGSMLPSKVGRPRSPAVLAISVAELCERSPLCHQSFRPRPRPPISPSLPTRQKDARILRDLDFLPFIRSAATTTGSELYTREFRNHILMKCGGQHIQTLPCRNVSRNYHSSSSRFVVRPTAMSSINCLASFATAALKIPWLHRLKPNNATLFAETSQPCRPLDPNAASVSRMEHPSTSPSSRSAINWLLSVKQKSWMHVETTRRTKCRPATPSNPWP